MPNNKYDDAWYQDRKDAARQQVEAVKQDRAARAATTSTLPSDDELRDMTNISAEDEAAMERAALAKQEGEGDDTLGKGYSGKSKGPSGDKYDDADKLKSSEKAADDTSVDNTDFKYTGGKRNRKGKGFWNKKRTSIAGGITGVSILGIIGLGGITSGPLQFIHLSQILGKNFQSQEDAGNSRMQGLYRFMRSGNVGETRLSFLESKWKNRMLADLAKDGMKIVPNKLSGQVGTLELDLTKNPNYAEEYNKAVAANDKDARDKVMRQALADNGMTVGDLSKIKNGILQISIDKGTISAKRSAIKSYVKSQNLGKMRTALRVRVLAKYYNAPSMFHPIKKLTAKGDAKIAAAIKDWKDKRSKEIKARTPEAQARVNSAKTSIGKIGGSALLIAGSVCVVRDLANSVSALNYENVVIPSVRTGVQAMSLGSQVMAGDDVDLDLLGAVSDDFYDKDTKTTIWDSAALKYEQGETGGVDMPQDSKQAFSPDNTSANIVNFIDSNLAGKAVCSKVGMAIQFVGGIALAALTLGTGNIISTSVGAAAGAGAVIAMQTFLPKLLADKLVPSELTGALGGNIAAYGVRFAANESFIASGGTALSPSDEALLRQQENDRTLAEFQSKSFTSRMFDVRDNRSLLGSIINHQTTNPMQNVGSIALSLLGGGNATIKNITAIMTPNVYAADTTPTYEYGFPKYGFSQADLDNQNLADPYENADIVASTGLAEKYKDDAMTCFGVDLTKDADGRLTANSVIDVNPSSGEYAGTDCVKAGNEDWLRVRMFILDMNTMESYACYNGDQSSCATLGVEDSGSTASTVRDNGSQTPTNSTGGYGATAEQLEGLPDACKTGNATGSVKFLCVGAKYRNLVPYLEVHPYTGKEFSGKWANGERDGLTLDCSLFIGTVLWDAYGVDLTTTSGDYVSDTKLFKKIPIADARPGDFFHAPGHIGIVLEPGKSILDTGWVHPTSPVDDLNIHGWNTKADYALRYIGPGAST